MPGRNWARLRSSSSTPSWSGCDTGPRSKAGGARPGTIGRPTQQKWSGIRVWGPGRPMYLGMCPIVAQSPRGKLNHWSRVDRLIPDHLVCRKTALGNYVNGRVGTYRAVTDHFYRLSWPIGTIPDYFDPA